MLDDIILAIGKPAFGDALFGAFRREVRARQVVLYDFKDAAATQTLVAKDDRPDDCVSTLVRDYLQRYHDEDPFRAHCRSAASRTVEFQVFVAPEVAQTAYTQHLFVEPGIAGKLSLIVRHPGGAICLTLYRDRKDGGFGSDDVSLIETIRMPLAAAIERHTELVVASRLPALDDIARILRGADGQGLSLREAQICARIVTGYSNEAIALDLGLSFHSVRTYRRRAYAKLGITSQNELFTIVLKGDRTGRNAH